MQKVLVVVDMQNDFIDGALGTKEAVAIVPHVEEKIRTFDGTVLFTRDTHETWYLGTQEGKKLPVPHCIRDTEGWQIRSELCPQKNKTNRIKRHSASTDLAAVLVAVNEDDANSEHYICRTVYRHLRDLQCTSGSKHPAGSPDHRRCQNAVQA